MGAVQGSIMGFILADADRFGCICAYASVDVPIRPDERDEFRNIRAPIAMSPENTPFREMESPIPRMLTLHRTRRFYADHDLVDCGLLRLFRPAESERS